MISTAPPAEEVEWTETDDEPPAPMVSDFPGDRPFR
jgi:hypothetical protein